MKSLSDPGLLISHSDNETQVDSWVICDVNCEGKEDEKNTVLGLMSYSEAHEKHMEYIARLRSEGFTVTKVTCDDADCRECQDDRNKSWFYTAENGEGRRLVSLFSCS